MKVLVYDYYESQIPKDTNSQLVIMSSDQFISQCIQLNFIIVLKQYWFCYFLSKFLTTCHLPKTNQRASYPPYFYDDNSMEQIVDILLVDGVLVRSVAVFAGLFCPLSVTTKGFV